jgi:hypothetical protein
MSPVTTNASIDEGDSDSDDYGDDENDTEYVSARRAHAARRAKRELRRDNNWPVTGDEHAPDKHMSTQRPLTTDDSMKLTVEHAVPANTTDSPFHRSTSFVSAMENPKAGAQDKARMMDVPMQVAFDELAKTGERCAVRACIMQKTWCLWQRPTDRSSMRAARATHRGNDAHANARARARCAMSTVHRRACAHTHTVVEQALGDIILSHLNRQGVPQGVVERSCINHYEIWDDGCTCAAKFKHVRDGSVHARLSQCTATNAVYMCRTSM